MQPITYSVSKGLRAGAIGGLIGSIVLGVLGGWTLHFLVGIIAGSLFLGATAAIPRFALTTTKRAVWVGILGGIAIWIVVYVPVTGILVPDDLTNTTFAGGSFVLHLLYGVVTALVSLPLLRRTVKTRSTA